jgi:flagellin-like hook-associated protein FlgL
MTAQIKGFQAAAKNINDAIAMVQTIDGALGEQITLLQRTSKNETKNERKNERIGCSIFY